MHEAGLIRNLVEKIQTIVTQEQAQSVTHVRVWLGALSHISADHFREHFEAETGGTIAAGDRLKQVWPDHKIVGRAAGGCGTWSPALPRSAP